MAEKTNYDIAIERVRPEFLTYDQEKMIQKFGLAHDDSYLYLRMLCRSYRISRKSGLVEWSEDDFHTVREGGYNDTMTIYDILCYSRDDCRLSGTFTTLSGLRYNSAFRSPDQFYQDYADYFDSRTEQLNRVCAGLEGIRLEGCDTGWQLPLFDFLPVRIQLWNSDEEFPASLRILWDENILDFMHFETTFYAAGHMLGLIRSMMEGTDFDSAR